MPGQVAGMGVIRKGAFGRRPGTTRVYPPGQCRDSRRDSLSTEEASPGVAALEDVRGESGRGQLTRVHLGRMNPKERSHGTGRWEDEEKVRSGDWSPAEVGDRAAETGARGYLGDTWRQLDLWAQSLLWVLMGEEGRLGVPVTADTQHPEPGRPQI